MYRMTEQNIPKEDDAKARGCNSAPFLSMKPGLSNQTACRLLEKENGRRSYGYGILQRKVDEDAIPVLREQYNGLLQEYELTEDEQTKRIFGLAVEQCSAQDEALQQLKDDLLEYKMMGEQRLLEKIAPPVMGEYRLDEEEESQGDQFQGLRNDPRRFVLEMIRRNPEEMAPLYQERSTSEERENMPFYHHAQMVLGQFEKYFAQDEHAPDDIISDDSMRLMLSLHDIYKLRSIERHGKSGEHIDTAAAVGKYTKGWGLSALQRSVAVFMTEADPFGDFFKTISDIDAAPLLPLDEKIRESEEACLKCAVRIKVQALKAGVPEDHLKEFFVRYMQFYQSDFSSYSTDSQYADKQEEDGDSKGLHRGPDSFHPEHFIRDQDSGILEKSETGFLKFSCEACNTWFLHLTEMLTGGSEESLAIRPKIDERAAHLMSEEMEQAEDESSHAPELNFYTFLEKLYFPRAEEMSLMDVIRHTAGQKEPQEGFDAEEWGQWNEYCARMMELSKTACENRLMTDFMTPYGGVFIRKLLPEYEYGGRPSRHTAREVLEREKETISKKISTQPISPYVLPATLVLEGVATNLTDAKGGLTYSSGILYDQSVPIAPSTKEHNESSHLSALLPDHVRGRLQDHEAWRGIVRKAIHPIGGAPYETREELAMKMYEMEDRKRGISPDLSTKELLRRIAAAILEKRHGMGTEEEPQDSEEQISEDEFLQECEQETSSEPVRAQLMDAFRLYRGDKEYLVLKNIPAVKKRTERSRSIYGGGKRGLEPGSRYHMAGSPAFDEEHPSSEQWGYDGSTFQTNEALLLPDSLAHIQGVYINRRTIASLIHGVNLAMEFPLQLGSNPELYTYEAMEGLKPVELQGIMAELEERIKSGEPRFGAIEGTGAPAEQKPAADGQPDAESDPPEKSMAEKKAFLLHHFSKQLAVMPPSEDAKKRR